MVEQRSPKPLVACSNRVSPAKNTFGCFFIARFCENANILFLIIQEPPIINQVAHCLRYDLISRCCR